MKNWVSNILIGGGCLIAGSLVGFFAGSKAVEKRYLPIFEDLGNELEETYIKLHQYMDGESEFEIDTDDDDFMNPIPEIQDLKATKPSLRELASRYRSSEETEDYPDEEEDLKDPDYLSLQEQDDWPQEGSIFEVPIKSITSDMDFISFEYYSDDRKLVRSGIPAPDEDPIVDGVEYLGQFYDALFYEERETIYIYNRFYGQLYEVNINHNESYEE